MIDVYWVGSLSPKPKYFELKNLPNYVVSKTETVEHCKDVLHVYEIDAPVQSLEDRDSQEERSNVFDIGDEETDRFFETFKVPDDLEGEVAAVETNCASNFEGIVQNEIETLQLNLEESRKVLCHRNPERFWSVLFRQKIDFARNDTSVIWAGKAGADGGGLYREFLLYSMEALGNNTLFMGKKNFMLFNCIPEDVINKRYKTTGQLTALAILYINHGPQCFHRSVMNYLFNINDINCCYNEDDFDRELYSRLKELKDGNHSALIDANIYPSNKIKDNIANFCTFFCLLSKASAIQQYKEEIDSVSSKILQLPCCFMKYFLPGNKIRSLDELRRYLKFIRSEEGSNMYNREQDAILEFELFLISQDQSNDIKIKDFLQFVAAVDRIPITGFSKPIERFFVDQTIFPKTSTC